MKQKILMLLAVVLLGSASAFAQSGNIEPARGDVNGDGVVDVADIAAVIKIIKDGGGTVTVGGYFYLGTTQPTAENYKTLPGVVSTYTSIDEAIGATATMEAGDVLYMLCPTAWMQGKSVQIELTSGETVDFLEEKNNVTVSGYTIYKTYVLNTPSTATLKTPVEQAPTYYYGMVDMTQLNSTAAQIIASNETLNANTSISTTYPISTQSMRVFFMMYEDDTECNAIVLQNNMTVEIPWNAMSKTDGDTTYTFKFFFANGNFNVTNITYTH